MQCVAEHAKPDRVTLLSGRSEERLQKLFAESQHEADKLAQRLRANSETKSRTFWTLRSAKEWATGKQARPRAVPVPFVLLARAVGTLVRSGDSRVGSATDLRSPMARLIDELIEPAAKTLAVLDAETRRMLLAAFIASSIDSLFATLLKQNRKISVDGALSLRSEMETMREWIVGNCSLLDDDRALLLALPAFDRARSIIDILADTASCQSPLVDSAAWVRLKKPVGHTCCSCVRPRDRSSLPT